MKPELYPLLRVNITAVKDTILFFPPLASAIRQMFFVIVLSAVLNQSASDWPSGPLLRNVVQPARFCLKPSFGLSLTAR